MRDPTGTEALSPVRLLIEPPQALLGASEAELRARLGAPSRREAGAAWPSARLGCAWIRQHGEWIETAYFGPAPPPLPQGEPYQRWIYRDLRRPGSQEVADLFVGLAGPRGARRVVAATLFPRGAVA